MYQFSETAFNALRKQSLAEGLAANLQGPKIVATVERSTGDVLAADPKGNVTRYSQNDEGFVSSVTTPMGRRYEIGSDSDGRLRSLTNPAGQRLGLQYDDEEKLLRVSSNSRKYCKVKSNDLGTQLHVEYFDTSQRRLEIFPDGRPQFLSDRLGRIQRFTYDYDNRLTEIVDGRGKQTRFEYNNGPQPSRICHPDGSVEDYGYIEEGVVGQISVGSRLTARIAYSEKPGKKIFYSDGRTTSFAYDDKGRVIEALSPEITVKFEYDGEGRVVKEDQGGIIVEYEYDECGSLAGMTYPTGEKINFVRDADLRLSSIADWTSATHRFHYPPGDSGYHLNSPNGVRTIIGQTPSGKIAAIDVRQTNTSATILSLKYERDVDGRVSSVTDETFETRYFTYDAENQLLAVNGTKGESRESFEYDMAGNRIRANDATAQYDDANRMTASGSTRVEYDERGNVISMIGNGCSWRYTYNYQNLMTQAEGEGQSVTFAYDAFGRRICKTSPGREVQYIWAGENLLREVITQGDHKQQIDYLYLPGTHAPLAMRIDGAVYYYHNDQLGTPRRVTDQYGKVVWSADHSAFGHAYVKILQVANPLRFSGQYFDEETQLHYNRFRYYSPVLGRYLSRDPITFVAGLNFYSYADNDPINTDDPLGLFGWKAAASFVAAVAVGIAVVALAPIALPLAIIAAGAAAGAVGFGLNQALNEDHFCPLCILKAMLKGAVVGAVSALPFLLLPETAGYLAFMGAGLASGELQYTTNWILTPGAKWDWSEFNKSALTGMAMAGAGKFVAGKYTQWKNGASEPTTNPYIVQSKGGYTYDTTPGNPDQPVLFGQKGVSPEFSSGGNFKGADIEAVAGKLKSGDLSASDVKVQYVWVNGEKVVVNNRSATTLSKAEIPQDQWVTEDMTGRLPEEGPDSLNSVLERLDEMGGKPSDTMPVRATSDRNGPIKEHVPISKKGN